MREIHKASIVSGALVALVAFGALAQGIGIDTGNSGGGAAVEYVKKISGASGVAGDFITLQGLTSNSADNATTTPSTVVTTTLSPGTYAFEYDIIYQVGTATTTGIGFGVDYSGTSSTYVFRWDNVETGLSITTGVGDGISSTVAGQLVSGKAERVKGTITTTMEGVDTVDSNVYARAYGVIVVTDSGDLTLTMKSETASNPVRVMAGSSLELRKIS